MQKASLESTKLRWFDSQNDEKNLDESSGTLFHSHRKPESFKTYRFELFQQELKNQKKGDKMEPS